MNLQPHLDPVAYVNPNIGTIGHMLTATIPIVALPHAMVQTHPVTEPGIMDRYLSDTLHGFAVGDALLMATLGDTAKFVSQFDHDIETVAPHHYTVLLEDFDIQAECTANGNSLFYRFTFPAEGAPRLCFKMREHGVASKAQDKTLMMHGKNGDAKLFAYISVSKDFTLDYSEDGRIAVLSFAPSKSEQQIEVRIGCSYIDDAQAQKNLLCTQNIAFEQLIMQARDTWNRSLGKIQVKGGTVQQRTIFYTALYRAMLHMNNITEDGRYFSGYDQQVHHAGEHDFYTTDNLWDSYRCMHPLQLLIEPSRQQSMIQSYVRMFQQSGLLPQFPDVGGDRTVMLGNHAAALVADTLVRGFDQFDVQTAYQALKSKSLARTMIPWADGPLTELDEVYYQKGFFPALKPDQEEWVEQVHPFEKRQAVAVTLEYAYDDWCIAQIANALGKQQDYAFFIQRSKNYQNLYRKEIGFMAPKSADGKWIDPYDPKLGGGQGGRDYFAECNAWIYSFHVQHDVPGLIALMGGKQAFESRLDDLFVEQYDVRKFDFLRQFPDATGLIGQYCQGNEPAFHIPYLYNYVGAPWKTQRRVRQIMDLWYTDTPLGICGDEDAGAMSSWYVFSAMGLYTVCPGTNRYDIGSPIFEQVTLHMENGSTFEIKAHNVSSKNKYIQSAQLNGKALNQPYFDYQAIREGGTLVLEMGERPNKHWGNLL